MNYLYAIACFVMSAVMFYAALSAFAAVFVIQDASFWFVPGAIFTMGAIAFAVLGVQWLRSKE